MFGILGRSSQMQTLFQQIEKIAQSDEPVLIRGETGTGKELVARAIHDFSPKKQRAFVPVNCGAIPGHLLESEMFGHKRGAFTGAVAERKGRFELAHGGSIFLDEIGDMPLDLQVKILRTLQEGQIDPVGSARSVSVDVRVIAATHQGIEEAVKENRFRADLFYRLEVLPITIPPLRERKEDILLLCNHFLEKHAKRHERKPVVLPPSIKNLFLEYDWPGNVRELTNLMARLTVLSGEEASDLDMPERILIRNNDVPIDENEPIPAKAFSIQRGNDFEQEPINLAQMVEDFENSYIIQALNQSGWNKNQAAKYLGMNRTTLVEKIKRRNLEQVSEEGKEERQKIA